MRLEMVWFVVVDVAAFLTVMGYFAWDLHKRNSQHRDGG
jgi:hypothetical protein